MKTIPLTQGREAIVDDEDYEYLNQFKWNLNCRGYAVRNGDTTRNKSGRRTIFMHRVINETPEDMFTDHIDGNPLNNRKSNLRNCNASQNNMNKVKQRGTYTSGYKGVSFHKRDEKWQAYIRLNRKRYSLGYFKDEKDAAEAYDAKAKELYGEFALLNLK